MSGPVQAAARLGDRISHVVGMVEHPGALVSIATGALVARVGEAGAAIVSIGAGLACGGGSVSVRDIIPGAVSGLVAGGSPRTFIGMLPAALSSALPIGCANHAVNLIRTGSATVFADGKALARAGDETACGATLCDGDATVLVGGASGGAGGPDPLALVQQGAALASAGLGAALAAGTKAIDTALAWGEAIAGQVEAVEASVSEVEAGADAAVGAIAAEAGQLLGEATSAVGALFGAKI